ncbi:MAG: RimK domain-containing protein ATP-grasp [Polyangiaceae bacterium]|nr:RimK domain-containing protein ATP-grasp [Polyangiaceae bacterium]
MILILSELSDPHVEEVVPLLREAGAPCFWYDPADFPLRSKLTLRHGPGGRSAILEARDRRVDLASVRVIWTRRPGHPSCGSVVEDGPIRRYAEEECADLLKDVWESLEAAWFPAPRSHVLRMQLKHVQLGIAAELGFTLPETLITNDPDAVFQFYLDHGHGPGKSVVSKLFGSALTRLLGRDLLRYTEVMGARDIAAFRSAATAPTIFQTCVPKAHEIRVTVVAGEAFAVEIHSQKTRRTRGDWRRYDNRHTPHRVHALPGEVAARCVALVRRLGLRFGAIDLILRPDGEYVFLELNPNGQYLWLEELTGIPLSRAIAEELLRLGGYGRSSPEGAERAAQAGARGGASA